MPQHVGRRYGQHQLTALDGVTELAAADFGGLGDAEALIGVDLVSGAGKYYVEIMGDATNSAQLLELGLSLSPSLQVFGDGFESGDTSKWSDISS